jgi:hypothetical protein
MEQGWPKDAEGRAILPGLRTFTLGAASRATAAFVFCPITVVKTRMVRPPDTACIRVACGLARPRADGSAGAQEYAAISGVVYRNTAHALFTIAKQARLKAAATARRQR